MRLVETTAQTDQDLSIHQFLIRLKCVDSCKSNLSFHWLQIVWIDNHHLRMKTTHRLLRLIVLWSILEKCQNDSSQWYQQIWMCFTDVFRWSDTLVCCSSHRWYRRTPCFWGIARFLFHFSFVKTKFSSRLCELVAQSRIFVSTWPEKRKSYSCIEPSTTAIDYTHSPW